MTPRLAIDRLKGVVMALVLVLCATAAASEERPSVVVFGDSLVAGYGLAPGESFPEKLQAALDERGVDVAIAGAGVSGDTTSGGLARLDWSVPEGTDGVILELGANDMLRGLPPKTTRENLTAMIERLRERGIEVMLAGMRAAPNLGPEYQAAFDAIYPDLAGEYGLLLDPFFLDGVTAVPENLLPDRMHPNAQGVDVMVARILPLVEEFVTRLGPSP